MVCDDIYMVWCICLIPVGSYIWFDICALVHIVDTLVQLSVGLC